MIDLAKFREVLHYCPETGVFTWIKNVAGGAVAAGTVAGTVDGKPGNQYIRITCFRKMYYAHHLAVYFMTGVWPSEVDHEDGNGCNNAWLNLRTCTHAENMQNKRVKDRALPRGVYLRRNTGMYQAQIRVNGKLIALGTYTTPELASEAYVQARTKLMPFNPEVP